MRPTCLGRAPPRGTFNPDFFIVVKDRDLVLVMETKADDGRDFAKNTRSSLTPRADLAGINERLEEPGVPRRYRFAILHLATTRWAHLGSNQGPLACEASALPLSYAPQLTRAPARNP